MNDPTSLPDAENVPETGKLPARYGSIINHAENEELVNAFRSYVSGRFTWYDGQELRTKFCGINGQMDIGDKMWRVSLQRDTSGNVQTRDTLSNVTSPLFHIVHRTLTASENTIFFQDDRLPAEFEPEQNTTEFLEADGEQIARQQNALEQYIFDSDERRVKIKEVVDFTNRYGMQLVGMEWAHEEREVTQHEPDFNKGKLPNGRWAAYKKTTRKRVTKDWPTFFRVPIEDAWLDPYIPDIQQQRCWGYRRRLGPEFAYDGQARGEFVNAGKITQADLFVSDSATDQTENQRRINAGESSGSDAQLTGEIEYWFAWARVPIDVDKKGKAKYAPGKVVPEWWLGVFAGDIHSGGTPCLRLIKNPYRNAQCSGAIPFTLVREMRDNKGLYSTSSAQIAKSLYFQSTTNINQAIDNITKRNSAPLIANGPIHTRDLTYRQNKVIQVDRYTKLEPIAVPDTTQLTMQMAEAIEDWMMRLTGADKPLQGVAIGGRQSATANQNMMDTATMPLDERADYKAYQLFPWMLQWDCEMMRQFGDPNTTLTITHENATYSVNPAELYGPYKTKVVCVSRFRNNTAKRREINAYLQNVLPLFKDIMGKRGLREVAMQATRMVGFDNITRIFPIAGDYESRVRARGENETMVLAGQPVMPQPNEDHEAHLEEHVPFAEQMTMAGTDGDRQNIEQFLRVHIAMHEQMKQSAETMAQGQAAAQQGGAEPPQGLPGELGANPMEAQMGAQGGA